MPVPERDSLEGYFEEYLKRFPHHIRERGNFYEFARTTFFSGAAAMNKLITMYATKCDRKEFKKAQGKLLRELTQEAERQLRNFRTMVKDSKETSQRGKDFLFGQIREKLSSIGSDYLPLADVVTDLMVLGGMTPDDGVGLVAVTACIVLVLKGLEYSEENVNACGPIIEKLLSLHDLGKVTIGKVKILVQEG
jgi:hypothetical protein